MRSVSGCFLRYGCCFYVGSKSRPNYNIHHCRKLIGFDCCSNLYFSHFGSVAKLRLWTDVRFDIFKDCYSYCAALYIGLCLQKLLSNINAWISKYKQWSFYLWAFALFVTIGQTIDFVVVRLDSNLANVLWLGFISLVICIGQFSFGKMIGKRYADKIAGGQMLAQKNTAMGIWMLNTFLNPIASVGLAFYSIWQNLFNSWQIYRTKI